MCVCVVGKQKRKGGVCVRGRTGKKCGIRELEMDRRLIVLILLIVSNSRVLHALEADTINDVDVDVHDTDEHAASLFAKAYGESGAGLVTRVMPSGFERETQASTGQTSGRWLVLIDANQRYFGGSTPAASHRRKLLEGVGFALELDDEVGLNAAVVVNERGSEVHFSMLMERFGLGDGDTAMILFHSRKMFRYTASDYATTHGKSTERESESEDTMPEKESRAIVEWIRNTIEDPSSGESVPPPPSFFMLFIRTIKAALGLDTKLSSSASKTSGEL